jgi:leucyl-tRNA synthetase
MRQWMLRITAYAERLLQDLDTIDWSDSLKEMQRTGSAAAKAPTSPSASPTHSELITVFTTRPDTLFGATYMVLAPEHRSSTHRRRPHPGTPDNWKGHDPAATPRAALSPPIAPAPPLRSDLERTELAKDKSGVFTGAYALNPVNRNASQSGSPIMSSSATAPAPSWPSPPMIRATSSSPARSISPSASSSRPPTASIHRFRR